MADPILHLNALRFRWPGVAQDTLDLPELHLQHGEHLFIRGASGSGKTTLLNLLGGITTPNAGRLTLLGTDLTALSTRQRDRFRVDHCGIIFQQFNLLPYLSVRENVTLPCRFSPRRRQRAEQPDKAAQRLLDALDLPPELSHRAVTELSTGQQQRVAAARALIGAPELIIADEPTSALDTDNRDRFLELLFQTTNTHGSTLIFVSHDAALATRFPRSLDLAAVNRAGQNATTHAQ